MSEIFEINLEDLIDNVKTDEKKNFDDIVDLDADLHRNICIEEIYSGLGAEIDSKIRFWNRLDDKNEIAIGDREPIKIFIDSLGGSLTDSLTIVNSIQLSRTPVITIALGCVYSGGFFIFIAGDKRYAYPNASFLYHEGSAGTQGTANQFSNFAEFYKVQLKQIEDFSNLGYDKTPICIAKTPLSFTDKAKVLGAPDDFVITIREVRLSAGAGFIVPLAGSVMTMPGLPKVPAATKM